MEAIIICLLPGLFFGAVMILAIKWSSIKKIYFKLRGKLMNFQEAIEKMKEGASIKRINSYYSIFKRGKVEKKGKLVEVFGEVNTEGDFKERGDFSMADIFADDWIVVDSPLVEVSLKNNKQ